MGPEQRIRIPLIHQLRNGFVFARYEHHVHTTDYTHRRPIAAALVMTAVMIFLPLSAAHSGFGWAGVAESEYTMGTAVSYSPNGDVLASGHKNSILISDARTHDQVQEILVDFPIESIEFTSDGNYMIVGMVSELPNTPGAVVFELETDGNYSRTKHTEDGKNVDAISVSADDMLFATANEEGSIVEWYIDTGTGTNLDINRSYPKSHNDHINCIDHSHDGTHLLSGSNDGTVIIWNRTNQTEVARWETTDPIMDCTFSPDGSTMAWIGGGALYLRNYDQTFSYSGQFDISVHATQVDFHQSNHQLTVLVDTITDVPRHLQFINASTLPIQVEGTLYLPHQALEFNFHPYLNQIAIATNSEYVAVYADQILQSTEIPSAIDSDQDNVPDNLDDDDDGDGILDLFDNICASGNNCHLKPDPTYMRNVHINIDGNDVTIKDTIHLDGQQSAYVRQLVADSVNDPSRVDQSEYDVYLFSMCDEYSPAEVKSRWASHLQFQNATFISNNIQCSIDSGLYATRHSDSGTRISITWTLTGVTTSTMEAPYNMTILNGLQLPSSSIAQIVHTFPIRVEIDDASGMSFVEEIWNRRDADLQVQVITPPQPEPSEIESVIDMIAEYWYAVFFAIICVGSMAFMIAVRRSNRIDFSELDEEVATYDETWEDMVDDAAAWDEDMDIPARKKRQPKPPAAVKNDLKRKPTPPAAVRADLSKIGDQIVSTKKVRKTSKKQEQKPVVDPVEFSHLIQTNTTISEEPNTDEDAEMQDALSFITSDTQEKTKKRRPVRRKKSND